MRRHALSFIEQSQNQTIFRVILHVSRMWCIVPRPERPPFARRLTLAAGEVYYDLVLSECRRNIQHVDKQTFGITVDGFGSRCARARGLS